MSQVVVRALYLTDEAKAAALVAGIGLLTVTPYSTGQHRSISQCMWRASVLQKWEPASDEGFWETTDVGQFCSGFYRRLKKKNVDRLFASAAVAFIQYTKLDNVRTTSLVTWRCINWASAPIPFASIVSPSAVPCLRWKEVWTPPGIALGVSSSWDTLPQMATKLLWRLASAFEMSPWALVQSSSHVNCHALCEG